MASAVDARADWSGYAPPVSSRKHVLPSSDDRRSVEERPWKPGRRGVANEKSCNASTDSILGGPVPARTPGVVGASSWQTEAQAAAVRTRTTREQLTESGRSRFVRGKRGTVPAYEDPRPYDAGAGARLRDEHDRLFGGGSGAEQRGGVPAGDSLVGYLSVGRSVSFLEGLGAEVVAAMSSKMGE